MVARLCTLRNYHLETAISCPRHGQSIQKSAKRYKVYANIDIGVYPRIQSYYSQDLATLIKQLLHVSPHLRPTCGMSRLVMNPHRTNLENASSDRKDRAIVSAREL